MRIRSFVGDTYAIVKSDEKGQYVYDIAGSLLITESKIQNANSKVYLIPDPRILRKVVEGLPKVYLGSESGIYAGPRDPGNAEPVPALHTIESLCEEIRTMAFLEILNVKPPYNETSGKDLNNITFILSAFLLSEMVADIIYEGDDEIDKTFRKIWNSISNKAVNFIVSSYHQDHLQGKLLVSENQSERALLIAHLGDISDTAVIPKIIQLVNEMNTGKEIPYHG